MGTVSTREPVNLGQLSHEMGRAPLSLIERADADERQISGETVTDDELRQAVAAHVADPNWDDPEAPPPSPAEQRRARLEELRAQARENPDQISQAEANEAVRLALAEGRL